jgi:hypothetical protein
MAQLAPPDNKCNRMQFMRVSRPQLTVGRDACHCVNQPDTRLAGIGRLM